MSELNTIQQICLFVAGACHLAMLAPLRSASTFAALELKNSSVSEMLFKYAVSLNLMMASLLFVSLMHPQIWEIAAAVAGFSLFTIFYLTVRKFLNSGEGMALAGAALSAAGCISLSIAYYVSN